MTFSVPEETSITIKGDFWLQRAGTGKVRYKDGRTYNFNFCHIEEGAKVQHCSPSLTVLQGNLDNEFYLSKTPLLTIKARIPGWSSFQHTFKTQPSTNNVTLYLQQEGDGPLSSSYFANLEIVRRCATCVPPVLATPLREEIPVTIGCNLPGWKISNAFLSCDLTHERRDNVLKLSDDGVW